MFLLLASVLGFVLFIILNIISDSIAQNPTTSIAVKNLFQSSFMESLNLIIAMVCPAAFIVGVVGSVAMFFRDRRCLLPPGIELQVVEEPWLREREHGCHLRGENETAQPRFAWPGRRRVGGLPDRAAQEQIRRERRLVERRHRHAGPSDPP